MTLKDSIISWILLKDQADYHGGIYLLKQVHPLHRLVSQPESDHNRRELLKALGSALKAGIVAQGGSEAPREKVSLQIDDRPKTHPSPKTDDLPGLSPSARTSMEIFDLQKNRAHYHGKLIQATGDQERKDILFKADQVTSEIAYKRKLIAQLDAGEISSLPEKEVPKGQVYAEVPDDLYELDNKLRKLRSTRSKRKARLEKLKAASEQNSPEWQELTADYEQIDKAIKDLEAAKKVRTQGGNS